jgi:AI-2 transport protein TqsA
MRAQKIAYSMIIAIGVVIVLIYGKNLLMPFVFAVFLWFIIKAIRESFDRISIKGKRFPLWLKNILAFLIVFLVLASLGKVLSVNINKISKILPEYQKNVDGMIQYLNTTFDLDIYAWIKDFSLDFDIEKLINPILNSISDLLGSAFMVLIYVVFLMIEEAVFPHKLRSIFKEGDSFHKFNSIFKKLNKSLNSYFTLKTLVSLITGILSYIILAIIGVDFAFFWAFLIFTFNFIPTIGSLVATIFPSLIALVQYNSFPHFFMVLALIGAVQVFVGNFLEPKLMGNSLNISPLVVIVALMFWGAVWGVLGMIMCVPITVTLIIVFAQFEGTRKFAIMLSSKGEV